ncbi:MAG: hypothetical protein EXQ52_02935 [Bryobacterales bacterium]|nr:hypothetical protein [Bryobacterales bacterium]
MAVLLVGIGLERLRRVSPPGEPERRLLSLARTSERWLIEGSGPLHQTFAVEVAQISPSRQVKQRQLEVWSDPRNARFALRLSDVSGQLEFGEWAPAAEKKYVFDRSRGPAIVRVSESQGAETGLRHRYASRANLGSIEAHFAEWLRDRRWRPVSFSADFAEFCSEDDVRLRLEKSGSESTVLRMSASRIMDGVRVTLTLDLDPRTHQARRLEIRWLAEDGAEALVQMTTGKAEILDAASMQPAVFQPDLGLRVGALRSRSTSAPSPAPVPAFREGPGSERVLENRILILETLHRMGADDGDEIAIGRRPDGGLVLEGIVGTARRREQISSLIEGLLPKDAITMHILDAETGWPFPESAPSRRAPPVPPATTAGIGQTLLGGAVSAYLDKQHLEETTGHYLHRITVANWSLMSEAWALYRLSHAVLPEEEARLSPAFRERLGRLVTEHSGSLSLHARQLLSLLEPLQIEAQGTSSLASCTPPASNWQTTAGSIFERAKRFSRELQKLAPNPSSPAPQPDSLDLRDIRSELTCLARDR